MNAADHAPAPLIYRAPASTRYLGVLFGGVLSLGSLVCLAFLLINWNTLDRSNAATFGLLCTLGLLGIPVLAESLRYRLTLHPQSMTLRGAFATETMARNEIAGYRMFKNTVMFMSRQAPGVSLDVKLVFKPDAAFLAWTEGMRDLSADDRAASLAALEAALVAGGAGAQPHARIARACRQSTWLHYAMAVLLLWGVCVPRPEWLVIALNAALPLVALELCRREPGIFSLGGKTIHSAKPDLLMLLVLPGCLLTLLALLSKADFSWTWCLVTTVALAAALPALFTVWRCKKGAYLSATLSLLPYAFGLFVLLFGKR